MKITETMNAWIKKNGTLGFSFERVPKPKISHNEVLIKVKNVGICGTDIGIYTGRRVVPESLIAGHELCGEVVDVGSAVKNIHVGDLVTPSIIINCGLCSQCRKSYEAQCDNLQEIGIHVDGGFAEYVKAPSSTLHVLPKDFSGIKGASVEPVAVVYNMLSNLKDINLNKSVIIFGPGPIGLYSIQILRKIGFDSIVIVGTTGDEDRLRVAKSLGAETINVAQEKKVFNRKFDVVIEATGNPKVVEEAHKIAAPHGKLILAGIYNGLANLDILSVVRNELHIYGSFCYSWRQYNEAVKLVINDEINIQDIVTHVLPLKKLDEGFALVQEKKAIKVILEN